MSGQRKVAIIVAEFLGTYVLATAMMSMLVRTNFAFFSAIAAGLIYGAMMIVFGSTSGSQLNPAVTIGLWTIRKVSTMRAVAVIIAQLLGGFVAWRLGQYFLAQSLSKIANGGVDWHVLIAEGVGTIIFGFGIAAAVTKKLNAGLTALVIGVTLFAGISIASLASNGLLNPAVALAVRSWSWAYVLGPILGSVVGMNLYTLLFASADPEVKMSTAKAVVTRTTTNKKKTTKRKK